MTDTPWLTRIEAAEYLRVHPATLDRYVRDGRLPKYRLSDLGKYRFKRSDLDGLLVEQD